MGRDALRGLLGEASPERSITPSRGERRGRGRVSGRGTADASERSVRVDAGGNASTDDITKVSAVVSEAPERDRKRQGQPRSAQLNRTGGTASRRGHGRCAWCLQLRG